MSIGWYVDSRGTVVELIDVRSVKGRDYDLAVYRSGPDAICERRLDVWLEDHVLATAEQISNAQASWAAQAKRMVRDIDTSLEGT